MAAANIQARSLEETKYKCNLVRRREAGELLVHLLNIEEKGEPGKTLTGDNGIFVGVRGWNMASSYKMSVYQPVQTLGESIYVKALHLFTLLYLLII